MTCNQAGCGMKDSVDDSLNDIWNDIWNDVSRSRGTMTSNELSSYLRDALHLFQTDSRAEYQHIRNWFLQDELFAIFVPGF